MATFKAVVLLHQVKADKTVRIKIRVTHKRHSRYIDANLTATTADITKAGKLKTQSFIDDTNKTIKGYRDKCNKAPERVSEMDIDSLITFLSAVDLPKDIDFIQFSRDEIERLKVAGREGVATNHKTAINALERFTGSKILPVSYITVKFLQSFETYIRENTIVKKNNKGMSRAPGLYMSNIRALHNKMKLEYNDEDEGVLRVPLSPFARYKLPVEKPTRKRAIEPEIIKKIFSLPDDTAVNSSGSNRFNLGKDCFILSFCLIGMNSADLYNCPSAKKGVLTYKRRKTSSRRKDEAEISVSIPPEVKALMVKYKDPTGRRAFNFYLNYSSEQGLNKSINKGLKLVGPKVGAEDLEYYAARHSWATIALNDVKIDKYTVHSALNHVDEAMRVTDIYLKKDWSLINNANRAVLDYIKKAGVNRL